MVEHVFAVHLAGVPVPPAAVLELAELLGDDELAARLRGALERGARILALGDDERDAILAVLAEPPDALAELRGYLLRERAA